MLLGIDDLADWIVPTIELIQAAKLKSPNPDDFQTTQPFVGEMMPAHTRKIAETIFTPARLRQLSEQLEKYADTLRDAGFTSEARIAAEAAGFVAAEVISRLPMPHLTPAASY